MRFLSTVDGSLDSLQRVNLLGVPLDCTTSFRAGTRFGPHSIRFYSEALESYSPMLDADLEDFSIGDLGDLPLPPGGLSRSLRMVEEAVASLYSCDDNRMVIMGGEHLLTLPVVSALVKRWPNLVVLQLDAHLDLRSDYEGEKLSHATVMYHVHNLLQPESLFQVGIRSGTRDEFARAREIQPGAPFGLKEFPLVLERIGDRPCYLSLDLDVVDPGFLPGTGAPEPGGITSQELFEAISLVSKLNLVGCDVVELSPPCDPTGASSLLAAKAVRELLLIMGMKAS